MLILQHASRVRRDRSATPAIADLRLPRRLPPHARKRSPSSVRVRLAGAALEQAHAQVAFERGHIAADRGGVRPRLARRGGEAAALGAADEGLQIGQVSMGRS